MFKKIISSKKFWPSVFSFAIVFIILFNIIRLAFEFKFNFKEYFQFYTASGHFFSFIVYNIIGGLFYGFVVVYFKYWRFYKEQNKQS